MEPKIGDPVRFRGENCKILRFSEDDGTQLDNYQWICMSEFERGEGGAWIRVGSESPRSFQIGEVYRNRELSRPGTTVVRPAVYETRHHQNPSVITTSPCCPEKVRRLDFGDLTSDLALRSDGWLEKCTMCGTWYRVLLKHTGTLPLGLFGASWTTRQSAPNASDGGQG